MRNLPKSDNFMIGIWCVGADADASGVRIFFTSPTAIDRKKVHSLQAIRTIGPQHTTEHLRTRFFDDQ
jgi:hypothetical protein